MKVEEYRNLLSAVSDAIASVKSAADWRERLAENALLRNRVAELEQAKCPRANIYDREKAVRLLERANCIFASTIS